MEDHIKPRRFTWLALIFSATVLILLVLALAFGRQVVDAFDGARRTVDKGLDLADKTIDETAQLLERFHTGRITHTFRESFPRVEGNNGDVLEVATNRVTEIFKRTDEKRLFWDRLYLGKTTVEIQVDAVFRYHVLLSDEWRLAARSNVCIVVAPQLRPGLANGHCHRNDAEVRRQRMGSF